MAGALFTREASPAAAAGIEGVAPWLGELHKRRAVRLRPGGPPGSRTRFEGLGGKDSGCQRRPPVRPCLDGWLVGRPRWKCRMAGWRWSQWGSAVAKDDCRPGRRVGRPPDALWRRSPVQRVRCRVS